MMERRALYNLLRMNWLNDASMSVEPWQVEDYRSLSLTELFNRLEVFHIHLDRLSFVAHADECDSPEELTFNLIGDYPYSIEEEDQIYLLVFELWRQLMIDKPSISIICHEMDYYIHLYDSGKMTDLSALQDTLTNFATVLRENIDQGVNASEVMQLVANHCANDIEMFLYDFISDQIDEGNEIYAQELFDEFYPYLSHNKWFKLCALRLSEPIFGKLAKKIAAEIIEDYLSENEIEYNFEFLSILIEVGDSTLFCHVVRQTFPLLKTEENFQDLLSIVADYFRRTDQEEKEDSVQRILDSRKTYSLDRVLHASDVSLANFAKLI